MANIEQPPLVSSVIRDGAVTELDHLCRLIANLSSSEWSRPSADQGLVNRRCGHPSGLVVGLYSPFLKTVLAGGGSSGVAKGIEWLTGSILPTAAPIFDMINGVVPKAVDRVLSPGVVKRNRRRARARHGSICWSSVPMITRGPRVVHIRSGSTWPSWSTNWRSTGGTSSPGPSRSPASVIMPDGSSPGTTGAAPRLCSDLQD